MHFCEGCVSRNLNSCQRVHLIWVHQLNLKPMTALRHPASPKPKPLDLSWVRVCTVMFYVSSVCSACSIKSSQVCCACVFDTCMAVFMCVRTCFNVCIYLHIPGVLAYICSSDLMEHLHTLVLCRYSWCQNKFRTKKLGLRFNQSITVCKLCLGQARWPVTRSSACSHPGSGSRAWIQTEPQWALGGQCSQVRGGIHKTVASPRRCVVATLTERYQLTPLPVPDLPAADAPAAGLTMRGRQPVVWLTSGPQARPPPPAAPHPSQAPAGPELQLQAHQASRSGAEPMQSLHCSVRWCP